MFVFLFFGYFLSPEHFYGQSTMSTQLKHFGGKGNDIINQLVICDKNLFFVGSFTDTISFGSTRLGSYGFFDGFLAKADSEGNIKWVKQIGGKLNDNITSVVVDKNGNSYVVGYFQKRAKSGSSSIETQYYYSNFLAKFGSSGNQLWIRKFNKHNQLSNCHLAIDSSGMVYFTGDFLDTLYLNNCVYPSKGLTDIFLAKSDYDGRIQWVKTIGGKKSDNVNAIFIDKSSNIFLGGSFEDSIAQGNFRIVSHGLKDALLVRIDNFGNISYLRRYGGIKDEEITAITTDNHRNIYATGNFSDSTTFDNFHIKSHGNQDAFIMGMNPVGTVKWIFPIGGEGEDASDAIYLTSDNKIASCGTFKMDCYFNGRNQLSSLDSLVSNCSFSNIFIGEYDSTGSFLDKYQINSSSESLGRNIAADRGDLFLCGTYRHDLTVNILNQQQSLTSFGNKDIFLLKISDKCAKFSVKINVDTIFLNNTKTYILDAGSGYQSYYWNDSIIGNQYLYTTQDGKYKVLVTNEVGCMAKDSIYIYEPRLKELLDSLTNNNQLSDNKLLIYPNPTDGNVNIKIVGNSDLIQAIELFDFCGKLVEKRDGLTTYNYVFDLANKPVGVYYLRIQTLSTTQCVKIIKQ